MVFSFGLFLEFCFLNLLLETIFAVHRNHSQDEEDDDNNDKKSKPPKPAAPSISETFLPSHNNIYTHKHIK